MQCATATAPLDWERPRRRRDRARARAARRHRRSHRLAAREPRRPGRLGLRLHRGLARLRGRRAACRSGSTSSGSTRAGSGARPPSPATTPAQMDDYLYGIVPAERGSDEWIDLVGSAAADFGQACSENTGDLLAQVDTVSAARDLDLLRAILGDEKLNYLGYSYGTFLGATYADLYPEQDRPARARRRDRPVGQRHRGHRRRRPSDSRTRCAPTSRTASPAADCPFDGTVDASMDEVGPTARLGRRQPAARRPTAAWSAPTRCSPRSSTRSTARSPGRTSARCSSR